MGEGEDDKGAPRSGEQREEGAARSSSPPPKAPLERMSDAIEQFVLELKEVGRRKDPDEFQITGTLGKGKFACVYKAKSGDALYAVKKVQIFEMGSVKSREKCLKEIKLLQQVSHENILQYKDSYIDPANEDLVIVLELAQGGDLKKLIRKVRKANRGFSERQVWKYCAEIAAALQHMHGARVMHRDLKPANIMLTRDNHIKLGDLGLSRFLSEQTMEAFSKVGTPLYMSPEVLLGKGYGFPADTWSLGCVLYELCVLRSPFKPPEKTNSLLDLFRRIKEGKFDPIPPGALYSDELRDLIHRMIVLEPDDRPPIDEVVKLGRYMYDRLGGQPEAPAPSAAPRPPPAASAASAVTRPPPVVPLRPQAPLVTRDDRNRVRRGSREARGEEQAKQGGEGLGQGQGQGQGQKQGQGQARVKRRIQSEEEGGQGQEDSTLVMSEVVEKLQVLHYEGAFCRPLRLPQLHHLYFALADKDARGQFLYFARLCSWLLTLNAVDALDTNLLELEPRGGDPASEVSSDNRAHLVKELVAGLRAASLTVEGVNTTQLTKGFGLQTCDFLHRLVNGALKHQFHMKAPTYPQDTREVEEVGGGDEEVADGGSDVEEGAGVSEDADGDAHDYFAPQMDRDEEEKEDMKMLEGKVDPAEWKLELERVGPKLRFKANAVSEEWRTHIEQSQKHESQIQDSFPDAKIALDKIGRELRSAIDRISAKELTINKDFDLLGLEFREKQKKLDEMQEQYNGLSKQVSEATKTLGEKTDSVELIKSQMNQQNNSMTDTSPLRKIQTALSELRTEVGAMELRIGIVAQTLLSAKIQAQNTTHQAASAKANRDGESLF